MIETKNTTNPPRSDCRQASRRLLRTREAAAYLGVSAWKLRRLVTDSRFPCVTLLRPPNRPSFTAFGFFLVI
jgi:hypothetical protein